jgi:2-oxoisovalerate dehydrogenase E1 component alpha subunit
MLSRSITRGASRRLAKVTPLTACTLTTTPIQRQSLAQRRHESNTPSYNPGPAQKVNSDSVNFPGAVNSKFTTAMAFQNPAQETAMPTYRYMDADGNVVDTSRDLTPVSDEEVTTWYRNMLTVSIMDLIMFDAQRQGRTSFYMVSAGEEGIAVGTASALDPEDVCFLQYREQGVLVQRGFTLTEMMNQLFANKDDHGKGRNMPVHYGSGGLNVHTVSSPLATQIPQASGAAYALKMQSLINPNVKKRIVACYFGEGAASEGDFHAALNIAATKSCPVVFVCRNNGFAISTASIEQYKGDGIASRGLGYGIDTIRVDGNDIFAVREVMIEARKKALEGDCKPILIEAMSYRVSHHSTSDDSFAYRAKREVEEWKRRDNPITRLRKWMENKGIWNEDMEKEARASIRKEVLREFAAAEKLKKPPIRAMFEDVYEEITPEARDQMRELKRVVEKYPGEYDVKSFEGGLETLDVQAK